MNEPSHTETTIPTARGSRRVGDDQRLARIAAKARANPNEKFSNLAHHIDEALVAQCIRTIPRDSATGTDGLTRDQTLANLDWLLPPKISQIHRQAYDATPVRRVYIPKSDGKRRPLGIPSILERGVQSATAKVLEQIYEQDFLDSSYGFRPGRGCHNALVAVHDAVTKHGLTLAYEVDIRDFFGSLSHERLLQFLEHRIGDKRILSLIEAWLKAGVIEEGQLLTTNVGSPQGGSISPILANVYLHYVLDLWFERKIKKQLKGPAALVRYCDDFVFLFRDAEDRHLVAELLQARLAQFGLEVAEAKTHDTDLGTGPRSGGVSRRHIGFLGFDIFMARTVSGKGQKVVFKTQATRFGKAKAQLKERLKKVMHRKIEDQAKVLNSILRGHYNYYGLPGNFGRIEAFHRLARQAWRRLLSRRSQRGDMSWKRFETEVKPDQLLARPKLRITYATLRQFAMP